MFLLIRSISAYTGPDLLLGIFTDAQRADSARHDYLARYTADPAIDPWHEQAYKTDGLTAHDLVITTLDAPAGTTGDVFVVSHYAEGFGQIFRKFDSIHTSEATARAREAGLNVGEEDDVAYALLQRACIDAPLSDAPDDQPSIVASS